MQWLLVNEYTCRVVCHPLPIPSTLTREPQIMTIQHEVESILSSLGVFLQPEGPLTVRTPITGEIIARLPITQGLEQAIAQAHAAFLEWRTVPAPKRGELVRLIGEELRASLEPLGRLVTIETGKLLSEGHGEVQ